MNIGEFQWPDYIPLERGVVKPLLVEPTIGEVCFSVPKRRGLPSFHADRSIVDRLIRMVEELLERDDVTPDADPTWYRNRLREIKRELTNAEDAGERGSSPSGASPTE